VKSVDSNAAVTVDLQSKIVTIETTADASRISKAVETAGYANEAA
jgi:copper chaperone CopZ